MPSRKGKGKQSLGFGSKAQRAQFQYEWKSRLQEDYFAVQQRQQKQRQRQQRREAHSNIHVTTRQKLLRLRAATSSTTGSSTPQSPPPPPQTQRSLLRQLLQERQYWDRVEDRQQKLRDVQANSTENHTIHRSPPGWLLYYEPHNPNEIIDRVFGHEFLLPTSNFSSQTSHDNNISTNTPTINTIPTLQSLSLHALAQSLPDYVEALGVDQLHGYLSLLPGPALSILGLLVSQQGVLSNELCQVLGRHSHLTRLCFVASQCEETDPRYKSLNANAVLQSLLPEPITVSRRQEGGGDHDGTFGDYDHRDLLREEEEEFNPRPQSTRTTIVLPSTVPDSWEEWDDDESDQDENHSDFCLGLDNNPLSETSSALLEVASEASTCSMIPTSAAINYWKGCSKLERLELDHLPLLDTNLLRDVLQRNAATLTHLGLSGSLTYDRGPDVLWQLSQWAPSLQVLDVSGNGNWVTEPLLRSVYDSYAALRASANEDGTATTSAPLITIKATGCLTRSSQLLMEMEFGTIF